MPTDDDTSEDVDLVIVGGSLAGLRAAESARRAGHRGGITMIGAELHLPYDRPPLSKKILDPETDLGDPPQIPSFHPEDHLRDELGVRLLLGTAATGVDTAAKRVELDDYSVAYDRLIIATGSHARTLPDQPDVVGVHVLRTRDDALAIRAALDAGARTVVIGGGFIGSEIASAARKRDLPVTIVESAALPLTRALGEDGARACLALHRNAGTELRLDATVAGIDHSGGHVSGVHLGDATELPADLVIVGVGAAPTTGWLESSALELHETDRGVLADATLHASAPDVWAAGDVVHAPNPLFDDELIRVEHWTNAAEQGAAAARNAVDPDAARPLPAVPYFWSDWYGHRIQFVGRSDADSIAELAAAGDAGSGYCALYRRGDRVVGALTIDRPRDIMKIRRHIAQRTPWDHALDATRALIADRA